KKLELSEADLTKYLKAQITKLPNSKNATRQRKVATIKSFLNWLYQEHYIENKLSLLFVLPKTKDKIPNFLSVDEVLSILRYFNSKEAVADSKTPAKKLLFLLLYGGGIRVSEACNLKPQDIKSNTVRVMGKGNKERIVVLPDFVVQQIGKIDKTHPYIWGDKPLHTRTAYDYIHQTGISANLLKSLHPHALRHSFATHMLADGCDLRVLQEALGHSSLQTTQKYLHLDLQKLSETLDKLSPINKVIK
ncbi:MAG: tyrosine-type recombinase/integrase, partial [Bdellovibrionales bacterium]|nr:tyrosine-type recombinase/integrase [Bdellovibrionales bacterium]